MIFTCGSAEYIALTISVMPLMLGSLNVEVTRLAWSMVKCHFQDYTWDKSRAEPGQKDSSKESGSRLFAVVA